MASGNDSLLTTDQCTFLEAAKDDQGINKGSNPYWWDSWDFWLTDNQGNLIGDHPQDGQTCIINVRFHLKYDVQQETGCPLLPGTDYIKAELFLCTPVLAMTPNTATPIPFTNPLNANNPGPDMDPTLFAVDTTDNLQHSKVLVNQASFTFHRNPNDPSDDGHRCLIARCFQHGTILFASPTDFYVPDDQHYGQHNLMILAVPGPRREGAGANFKILTNNTNQNAAQAATIKAVADLNPSKQILDLATPRLQRLPTFKRIVTTPSPKGFNLDLPDFPNATVRDHSNPFSGCLGFLLFLLVFLLGLVGIKFPVPLPTYEADITMNPGQQTNLFFRAVEPSSSRLGDARVYHITHLDAQQRVLGGLTLITVVTS